MRDYMMLIAGVACAAAGGELFVRSAVGFARALRVSPAIIGATIAAFATSSPELAVAIGAAVAEKPQIALGDALGSSVVNVALILGLVITISPVRTPRGSLRRDFPVACAVPPVFAVLLWNGVLSSAEGVFLLLLFAGWLALIVRDARRERSAAPEAQSMPAWRATGAGLIGLALLFAAGRLIVDGASGIARSLGMTEFAIGATVVAVGTSAPELATALVAKLRGHDEVGLGTLLGSNIFNGLWIVPVAAMIFPIEVAWRDVATALGFGLAAIVLAYPGREGLSGRGRGLLLLLCFVVYSAAVLVY